MAVALVARAAQVLRVVERSHITAVLCDVDLRADDVINVGAGSISFAQNSDGAEGISREYEWDSSTSPRRAIIEAAYGASPSLALTSTIRFDLSIVDCMIAAVATDRRCLLAVPAQSRRSVRHLLQPDQFLQAQSQQN